jgi:hypothetical protein
MLSSNDKDHVKSLIREAIASFFFQTKISRTDESSDPAADTIVMDDGIAEPVARLEQYGDVVVPPGNVDTVCWHRNVSGVQMPLSMKRWRPDGDDSKVGTRGLYTDSGIKLILHGSGSPKPKAVEIVIDNGASIIINKDGAIAIKGAAGQAINIDAGAGANVVLQGGTADVARKGDKAIADTTMAAWIASVQAAVVALLAGGVAPGPVAPTDFGVVNGGNPRIKG